MAIHLNQCLLKKFHFRNCTQKDSHSDKNLQLGNFKISKICLEKFGDTPRVLIKLLSAYLVPLSLSDKKIKV